MAGSTDPWEVLKHYDCASEPSTATLFSVACALYWYATDYHNGQWSDLYAITSTLDYRPGPAERGPEPESPDADIYRMLELNELDAVALHAWFQAEWPKAKAREDQ